MPPSPPFTTVRARIPALAVGGLCVLVGGLFLVVDVSTSGLPRRGPLRDAVVTLGGAALCLAAVRPALRPGWRTMAALVIAGAAAAPATYWIRHDNICCEFVWVGSYGYPWRWGTRAMHSSTYPENGDALLTGGGLPLDIDPVGLILDGIFWTYALLLCWLVLRLAVLWVRAARPR